jgi:Mor family transcriptional regulator
MFRKFKKDCLKEIEPYINKTGINLIKLTKGKTLHNAIPCKSENLITGEIYAANSILELSNKMNINKSTIYKILKNKKHKKWKIILLEYQ